jgi:hypothetical protein
VGANVAMRKPGATNSNEGETKVTNSRTGRMVLVT